jgi:hypothetical protein
MDPASAGERSIWHRLPAYQTWLQLPRGERLRPPPPRSRRRGGRLGGWADQPPRRRPSGGQDSPAGRRRLAVPAAGPPAGGEAGWPSGALVDEHPQAGRLVIDPSRVAGSSWRRRRPHRWPAPAGLAPAARVNTGRALQGAAGPLGLPHRRNGASRLPLVCRIQARVARPRRTAGTARHPGWRAPGRPLALRAHGDLQELPLGPERRAQAAAVPLDLVEVVGAG